MVRTTQQGCAAKIDQGDRRLVDRIHDVIQFQVPMYHSSFMALHQHLCTHPSVMWLKTFLPFYPTGFINPLVGEGEGKGH
jgi:hypothetical protein